MAELLIVANPKRRRRKKARRSRKGRMPAGLRRYWAAKRAGKSPTRRRRRRHARAAAPRRRSRRRSGGTRHPVLGYTQGTKRIRRRKLNPHRRHRYRRRHNPSMSLGGITRQFMPVVKAGGVGAAGALALDGVWGFVNFNLPSVAGYLTNPYVALVAKYGMAIAVGSLGGHLLKGKGRELAVGGATVVTHDFLKGLLQSMAPTLFGAGGSFPLGSLGSYLSGAAPIVGTATFPKAYMPFNGLGRVGAYMSGSTGTNEGPGVYADDAYGFDPWAGGSLDANTPWY